MDLTAPLSEWSDEDLNDRALIRRHGEVLAATELERREAEAPDVEPEVDADAADVDDADLDDPDAEDDEQA